MSLTESELAASEWLRQALQELRSAEVLAAGVDFVGPVLWHCHLTIEKGFKGLLILNGIEFPLTHNLVTLRAMLPEASGVRTGTTPDQLSELRNRAMEARYPAELSDELDRYDRESALRLARKVVDLMRADFPPSIWQLARIGSE